jgi:hypothetical protein
LQELINKALMVSYILIVVDVNVVVGGVVAFELFLLLAKLMTVRETSFCLPLLVVVFVLM